METVCAMSKDEIEALKLPIPENIDQTRLGDDPEREKGLMFVRGWNSAIDCICGVGSVVSRENKHGEAA